MGQVWRSMMLVATVMWAGVAARTDDVQQAAVDQSFEAVKTAAAAAGLTEVIQIDHARLAAAEGVTMPPARVQLFSDPALNAVVLSDNIRAGLDLPFRVLSFDDRGTSALSYTSSAFLAQRHGLTTASALVDFDDRLNEVLSQLTVTSPLAVSTKGVEPDFAVLEIKSKYGVDVSVERLKQAVTAQSDTIWFGDIDFQAEAASHNVSLRPARLLLFGGPAPGGVAMAEFPAIGLDAFCQKLLVYEGEDGNAVLIFNDIAALARLHYGRSIEPHDLLNQRLIATFRGAVE